ncbi:hypothetical protein B0J18DRAFT_107851 [Chaetomium sp. MPI-SDFR-AT-0129]|nr:hypothetical protein B0J18DRAFT_107851 [Chaetomium sp. MPI-SDFR-AT-0129]
MEKLEKPRCPETSALSRWAVLLAASSARAVFRTRCIRTVYEITRSALSALPVLAGNDSTLATDTGSSTAMDSPANQIPRGSVFVSHQSKRRGRPAARRHNMVGSSAVREVVGVQQRRNASQGHKCAAARGGRGTSGNRKQTKSTAGNGLWGAARRELVLELSDGHGGCGQR